jgi:hypothetical protein
VKRKKWALRPLEILSRMRIIDDALRVRVRRVMQEGEMESLSGSVFYIVLVLAAMAAWVYFDTGNPNRA